jgi:hypothetical protein
MSGEGRPPKIVFVLPSYERGRRRRQCPRIVYAFLTNEHREEKKEGQGGKEGRMEGNNPYANLIPKKGKPLLY